MTDKGSDVSSFELSNAGLIEAFLEMMAVDRAAAANTLKNYGRDLLRFASFSETRRESLKTAGTDDIAAWLAVLESDGIAASTAALKVSALKQFYQFLYTEGYRSDNPATLIDRPKTKRPLPKVLSGEEVGALFEAVEKIEGPKGARFLAMLEILYSGEIGRAHV